MRVDPPAAHIVFLVLEEQHYPPRNVRGYGDQRGSRSCLLDTSEARDGPPLVVMVVQGERTVRQLATQPEDETVLSFERGQVRLSAAGGSECA